MGLLDDLRSSTSTSGSDFADAWRPQPGDGIEGTVVRTDVRRTDDRPDGYVILTVDTGDGEQRSIHTFHTVLSNEMQRLKPRVGDQIAVVYDGQKTSQSGRTFHAYRVAHKPGDNPEAPDLPPVAQATSAKKADDDVWAKPSVASSDNSPPF